MALQCCKICRFEQEEGRIVAFYVIVRKSSVSDYNYYIISNYNRQNRE